MRIAVLLLVLLASAAPAQDRKVEIESVHVAGSIHMIKGGFGGNLGVWV